MKRTPSIPDAKPGAPGAQLKRRGMLLGAGVAAVAGGVAAALAARQSAAPVAAEHAQGAPKQEDAAGYRLTQHVLRYYETTRV